MRAGIVKLAGIVAGRLEETEQGFAFQYEPSFLVRENAQAISLTLPLRTAPYDSPHLFAFFEGLLAEGTLRAMQCRTYQIDEDDSFGLLLQTASSDVIGNVTIEATEASA